jgi:hypothetical protein
MKVTAAMKNPLVETFSALTTFLGSLLPLGFGDRGSTVRVPCNITMIWWVATRNWH